MSRTTLLEDAEQLFRFAIDRTASRPTLRDLHSELQQSHERLHQPMRVAIVGKIKAGKSTMMNALLGEEMVATGIEELTFNVNWLRYGDPPYLRVHFKDGRLPEPRSLGELEALTRRRDENRGYLASIQYVEVFYPSDALKMFNLIDTPGLESYFAQDTRNTLDFLGLSPQDLTEATETEASNADAVLYLFSHGMGQSDHDVMTEFQGPTVGQVSPINAIGVLTKADIYWPSVEEPAETGRRITRRLMSEHRSIRSLFYNIYPVSGLVGFGARTLTSDEFDTLCRLTTIPWERFERLVRHRSRFGDREYENIPIPASERRQVLSRLGQYGVWEACRLIRAGIQDGEQLGEKLYERSGLQTLEEVIRSHFGNRAFLIKLNTGFRQVRTACFREQTHRTGVDQQIVREIRSRFEALEAQQHAFQELRVLRSHYEGKLEFATDEEQQLLEVTGEFGTSCGERLGLGERATVGEMLPLAKQRVREWQQRANDIFAANRETITAANVLARSYERIVYHVTEAGKHLYM
jgi:hypothetical protein